MPARGPVPSRTRRLLLFVFFLSGASGLIYEIAWMRRLTHVFGSTTLAVSTVLAAFMGGLALGSIWIGRLADRRPESAPPLREARGLDRRAGPAENRRTGPPVGRKPGGSGRRLQEVGDPRAG